VLGVEGDLSYVNGAKSFDSVTQGFATVTTQYGERFGWLGTIRGRVGVAIDRVLVYGTGGFAAAEVKSNAIIFPAGAGPILAGNSSETRNGWTVGGGVEIAFAPGLTFKTEYLFVDLGRMQQVTNTISGGAAQSAIFQHDKEAHVVRVGVNVQLQPPPPPQTESLDTVVQGARVRF
jgi:outer membrane immunogenic protein